MRLRNLPILTLTFTALIIINQPASAQSTATATATPKPPHMSLIIGANNGRSLTEGDLWSWNDSELAKRTGNNHSLLPIVSPTGDWAAYEQIAPAFVRLRTDPLDDSQDQQQAPTDLYLYNLKTYGQFKIAGQPNNPGFALDGTALYTIRSQPSWAPDGTLLAWTEIAINPTVNPIGEAEQLVVYDLATKTTQVIVSPLPPHRSAPNFPILSEVSFGPNGKLAVQVRSSPEADPNGSDAIFFYDLTGNKLSEVGAVTDQDHGFANTQMIWLTGQDQPYLSCIGCTTEIDPGSGTQSPLNGTPEMYSTFAPDQLSLYYGADSGDEANVTWIIALNGKQVSTFGGVRIANMTDAAISPDGLTVGAASFSGQGSTAGVLLFNGQTQKTDQVTINVTGLGWGPIAWRVHPLPSTGG